MAECARWSDISVKARLSHRILLTDRTIRIHASRRWRDSESLEWKKGVAHGGETAVLPRMEHVLLNGVVREASANPR